MAFGASVCWGAALPACGGKSVYGTEEGADDAELGGDEGAGSVGTGRLPELACTQPVVPLDETRTWTAEEFGCCAGYVEGKAPLDAPLDAPRLAADPSVVNCCLYVVNSYYELTTDAGATLDFPFAAHSACCYPGVLGEADRNESFCTPWGPPVPPALATELEVA